MAEMSWSLLTRPGDVFGVAATADGVAPDRAPAIAAYTEGGHVYARREDGPGWRWEHLGAPPGSPGLSALHLVALDAGGTVAPVVVGRGDGHVWLGPSPGAPGPWVDLGAPEPDTQHLAVATLRRPAGLRHVLVAGTNSGHPWLQEGLDPDGTWFRIAGEVDWRLEEVDVAVASTAPDATPQPHVVAIVRVEGPVHGTLAVRVALRENSVWTWIDPGPLPQGVFPVGLSATSFREPGGEVRAAAVVGVSPFESGAAADVGLLAGAGRSWRWQAIGSPPGQDLPQAAVTVRAGPEVAAGSGPVVVARVGRQYWRRSASGEWVPLGTIPGDPTVVNPGACVEIGPAGARRLWATGVGWDAHLWTMRAAEDGTGALWHDHGIPAAVTSIVGADEDPPEEEGFDGLQHIAVVDDRGGLFRGSLAGDTIGIWDDHGHPAAGVTARTGIGSFTLPTAPVRTWMFVLGSDGNLWARTWRDGAWTWVGHGRPGLRPITSALPPIAAEPSAPGPCVAVMDDGGQLSLLRPDGGDLRWIRRGAPQGHLIGRPVGIAPIPTAQGRTLVTAVVADDGHLWLDAPGVHETWADLGTPTATEQVTAAVGATTGRRPDGSPVVHVVVVAMPGGHAWTRVWPPAGPGPAQWTDLGRPAGARIEGRVGVLPEPRDFAGGRVFLLADGGKLWVRRSTGDDAGWELWDRSPELDRLAAGRAVLLRERPSALMTGADGRFWLAASRHS